MVYRIPLQTLLIVTIIASWAGAASGDDAKPKEDAKAKPIELELEATFNTDDGPVPRYCFAPKGNYFATASAGGDHGLQGVAKLWDAQKRTVIWKTTLSPWDAAVKISPDGEQVLAGRSIFDLKGNLIQIIENTGPIKDAIFAPDGRRILVSSVQDKRRGEFGDAVFMWDTKTKTRIKALEPGDRKRPPDIRFWWPSIAWSADGKTIAACIGEDQGATDLTLWDAETFDIIARVPAHDRRVYSVEFSPSGRMLASGGTDGTIKIWRIDDAAPKKAKDEDIDRLIKDLDDDDFQTREKAQSELEALGPPIESRMRALAKDSDSAEVRVRAAAILKHLQGGKLRLVRTIEGNPSNMQKILFHADGEHVIASSENGGTNNLYIWNIRAPDQPVFVHRDPSGLFHIALSPDGKTMASSHRNGSVKLWRVKTK